jgi:hypothetical protein
MKNFKELLIEYLNDDNTRKDITEVLKPITEPIYNELYIYIWIICFYSILLFLIILANLFLLLKIFDKTKFINMYSMY